MESTIAHVVHTTSQTETYRHHYLNIHGTSEPTTFDNAFMVLVKKMQQELSSARRVNTLTSKRSRFTSILQELAVPKEEAETYSSWKLKRRLQAHFRNKLSFLERPGLSDLICFSKLTVLFHCEFHTCVLFV